MSRRRPVREFESLYPKEPPLRRLFFAARLSPRRDAQPPFAAPRYLYIACARML